MARLEVHRALDVQTRQHVYRLVTQVQARTGHRPLSDHLWLDLVEGGRKGFGAVVAWDADALVGYAQLSAGHDVWTLEVVQAPVDGGRGSDRDTDPEEDGSHLVRAALDLVASSGGGEVHWWAADPTEATEQIAARNGLVAGRTLLQMRVDLPIPDKVAGKSRGIATRAFQVGRDEEAWIAVNNAAFAKHPEQGGWDLPTLRQREAQPWFDPEGFRLHEREGRLAAFCWTKVHAPLSADDAVTPVLGEIYVIAVHPDFHGLGLGKALTVAGLDHLAAVGITTGMLYVDRDNVAAVELYRRLGFTTHRTDRAFVAHVPAGDPPTPRPDPTRGADASTGDNP